MTLLRDFSIAGECIVCVKGRGDLIGVKTPSLNQVNSVIGSLTQLGLSLNSIDVKFQFYHKELKVNSWGGHQGMPAEIQSFGATADVSMVLVHYSPDVLDACVMESLAGAPAPGAVGLTGGLLGNAASVLTSGGAFAGNHYISLNIIPAGAGILPYRFLSTYLSAPPLEIPLGTKASAVRLNWRAIVYGIDPHGATQVLSPGGNSITATGAYGFGLYDRQRDS